ncbi:hypothetical protein EHS25_006794 [Saitozyma podzolica]|uniref:Glucuronyl hydrolase n=1 Tax=Saitozyma podzolica TaxID=1890683 RepID=A0A427XRL4_9TREE|nr:hypothetical protein EHS25_006794 [Saitozyma podzolica]
MHTLQNVAHALPGLYDPALSVKIVEVAKKYDEPEGKPITRIPEYTVPGGPNSYHCSKIETSWTQGFFPGLLWLLAERAHLLPESIDPSYTASQIQDLGRRWQEDFKYLARPSINHDQGFRFQLSYGRDLELTGSEEAKRVIIDAAESLVGCIRSWDKMVKTENTKQYTLENMDEHFLVIIDNMMNLDMLYLATDLTGDKRYAEVATRQAEVSMTSHVRKDYSTYHVVNFDQTTGQPTEFMTHQGYADESIWSRGQAWGIYGYAQCALRTGRSDFIETSRRLADVFLSHLGPSGVPLWDFSAPQPCPYDASAATIAARGLQMLYQLLLPTDPQAAEMYLSKGFKLVEDVMRECGTGRATLQGGKVNWGEGGWETLLKHSTINGNEKATRRLMDHGLVYADYYLIEFGNEALKLQKAAQGVKA